MIFHMLNYRTRGLKKTIGDVLWVVPLHCQSPMKKTTVEHWPTGWPSLFVTHEWPSEWEQWSSPKCLIRPIPHLPWKSYSRDDIAKNLKTEQLSTWFPSKPITPQLSHCSFVLIVYPMYDAYHIPHFWWHHWWQNPGGFMCFSNRSPLFKMFSSAYLPISNQIHRLVSQFSTFFPHVFPGVAPLPSTARDDSSPAAGSAWPTASRSPRAARSHRRRRRRGSPRTVRPRGWTPAEIGRSWDKKCGW